MKKIFKKYVDFVMDVLLAICLDVLIVMGIAYVYLMYFSQGAQDDKVREIYRQIVASTGQSQNEVPLIIVDEPIDNAYTDGTKVVIYTGLINHTESWDEVALVLAHEVAHVNLVHVGGLMPPIIPDENMGMNDYIAVMEANADKMGAVYMMKAGYDVCKGRELFKHWKAEKGNAIGQSHPDYSYRYDELNINCDRNFFGSWF